MKTRTWNSVSKEGQNDDEVVNEPWLTQNIDSSLPAENQDAKGTDRSRIGDVSNKDI